ncbi:hypothetical protein LJ739_04230 [Aestuariibacter halophilus]|uniref:Lipoprotein n=1 Tax=Fluctibacter halophilus TaxID=226011 RepID=A0ABS8G5Q2_9ALTE|nr:hypothetical protein [Aestuariibacter halophilus]MCC2615446.1 hypothetical protein [Aestuariibacter halophilus]
MHSAFKAFSRPVTTLAYSALATVALVLSGCANYERPCEEILEVKRQHQECEDLRKIMNKKGYPQQALTAQKRYEEACTNLRYYRDDYDTICKGDQKPIGAVKEKDKN